MICAFWTIFEIEIRYWTGADPQLLGASRRDFPSAPNKNGVSGLSGQHFSEQAIIRLGVNLFLQTPPISVAFSQPHEPKAQCTNCDRSLLFFSARKGRVDIYLSYAVKRVCKLVRGHTFSFSESRLLSGIFFSSISTTFIQFLIHLFITHGGVVRPSVNHPESASRYTTCL